MKTNNPIPESFEDANNLLHRALRSGPCRMTKSLFLRTWNALFYLHPNLHPDGFRCKDGGWPRSLRPLVREAWRRWEAGRITESDLYPSDAAWLGLYDRMEDRSPDARALAARLRS